MALSGSFNTTKYSTSSHGTLGLNVSWTATQNIANNTSTIKWTVKSNGTMSSGYYVKCYKVVVIINGTKVLNTTSDFNMYGDGKYKKTGTITITHGSDGNKTVAMSAQANIYYSGDGNAQTGSKSFTLDKINRYALVSSITNFTNDVANDGYPKLVYTNPAGTSLTTGLKVRLAWNNEANYTDWVTLNDEGGEYTFTSSTLTSANITSMLNACPDSNVLSLIVDLQSTMNEVEYHDKKTVTMNVVDANPTFSVAPSFQDALPAIAGHSEIIVQKQSKLRIYHGTAQAQKGASLMPTPYSLNFNGQNYGFVDDYVEFDKPDLTGVYTATITAVDTRGNFVSHSFDISILEWSAPTAECSLERQNSFNTDCDLKVIGHISDLDGINTLTITEKHRIIGSSSWSQETSVPDNTEITIALANTSEWEMEITLSDIFGPVEPIRLTVGKGIPYIYKDYKRNSFAFNSIPDDDDQFKIGGQLKCESMYVEDISSQYTITKTSGNANFEEVKAHRCGNVITMQIMLRGAGSTWTAGSNIFAGTVTGPLPAVAVNGCGYYDNACFIARISNSGGITFRWLVATKNNVATSQTIVATLTFITND